MSKRPHKWDVFISHASEDKKDVARPLAEWLERHYGLRVWFDEFELKPGDSLRRSIDYGLANSKFGVVIISKNFMSKEWPQEEFAALATKKVIPIWHGVTSAEVRDWSSTLADKVALNWTPSPDTRHAMIKDLVRAMDLPFSANMLSGIWRGSTGRLRLLYDGNTYYTPSLELYDGDYDWNGRNWSGQIHGAFSLSNRIFLFEWSWKEGAAQGVGFLQLNESEDSLVGGWKLADDRIAFSDFRPDRLVLQSLEFPLQEFRRECNAWTFVKSPLDDKAP